jgi:hypothetical protein
MNNLVKVPYEVGKKTVDKIRRMNVKGAVNTASNVALGAGVVSMLPLTASPATEQDIDRMKQYQPQRQP